MAFILGDMIAAFDGARNLLIRVLSFSVSHFHMVIKLALCYAAERALFALKIPGLGAAVDGPDVRLADPLPGERLATLPTAEGLDRLMRLNVSL